MTVTKRHGASYIIFAKRAMATRKNGDSTVLPPRAKNGEFLLPPARPNPLPLIHLCLDHLRVGPEGRGTGDRSALQCRQKPRQAERGHAAAAGAFDPSSPLSTPTPTRGPATTARIARRHVSGAARSAVAVDEGPAGWRASLVAHLTLRCGWSRTSQSADAYTSRGHGGSSCLVV
jgi:hypothetical protein